MLVAYHLQTFWSTTHVMRSCVAHARFTWRRLPHAAQPTNANTCRPAPDPLPLPPYLCRSSHTQRAVFRNGAQQGSRAATGAQNKKPSVSDEGLLQTFSRQKQPKDSLLLLAYFLALAALSSLGASVLGAAAASGAAGASGLTGLNSSFCLFTRSSTSLVTSLLES